MQDIMEHYGMALLGVVEVLCVYAVLLACMEEGGSIYNLVIYFLEKISG